VRHRSIKDGLLTDEVNIVLDVVFVNVVDDKSVVVILYLLRIKVLFLLLVAVEDKSVVFVVSGC
jgi:hypothetical protein